MGAVNPAAAGSGGDLPTAWHAVVDFLRAQGVDTVFGLPDDDLGLLDALEDSPVRAVLCRGQRNAVFMAAGHALATGRPAVCVVGRGPALASALPGLVEAAAGRAPVVLLASGTAGDRMGTGAFQELDQLPLVRPLVKHAQRVESAARLPGALERAWLVAASGAPGPVYLELPDHMAGEPVPRRGEWRTAAEPPRPAAGEAARDAAGLLDAARRPVLLVGGGMRGRNADRRVERLAEALGAAVAVTASGRGTVDEAHPLFCGLAGLYAPQALAPLWREADLVVALGSRLEETAVHGWEHLAEGTRVVQVNTEAADFAVERPGPLLLGDAGAAVADWLVGAGTGAGAGEGRANAAWQERIAGLRGRALLDARELAEARAAAGPEGPAVVQVLAALDRTLPADRVLVQENGLADMWSYCWPHWSCAAPGGSVVPSEQTSLGFGAAAAIGVQLALPGRPVAALVGDGAFGSLGPDLLSAAEAGAPVLYVVLDNGGYGWLQHALDTRNPGGSRFRFTAPGRPVAEPGGEGPFRIRAERPEELDAALAEAWRHCAKGRPAVVEVAVRLGDLPPLPPDVLAPAPAPADLPASAAAADSAAVPDPVGEPPAGQAGQRR
ncbi:thiamine pyrophosphate-binding protein [Kitasatospora sp. NPDC004240]